MSYFVYFVAVGSIAFSGAHCSDNIPPPIIVAYEPFGIQLFLTDIEGVSKVSFYANINRELKQSDLGDIFLEATEPNEDGKWIIKDEEYELKIGDVIYYALFVTKFSTTYKLDGLSYEIKDMIPAPTTISTTAETTPSTLPPTTSTNPPTTQTTTLTSTAASSTQTTPSTTGTSFTTTSSAVSASSATPVTVPPSKAYVECGDNIYVDIDGNSIKIFKGSSLPTSSYELLKNLNENEVSLIDFKDCSIDTQGVTKDSDSDTLTMKFF